MNNLSKAAIGITSTGTVCTGGYFVCKEYIFSSDKNAPITSTQNNNNQVQQQVINRIWKSLDTTTSNYSNETIGKIYGDNLLDPYDESNEDKWKELHQKISDDENNANGQEGRTRVITSNEFQASIVSNAFAKRDESTNSALNKKCQSYYEKEIEGKGGTDNSKIQIGESDWKALWMLCSEWNPKMLDVNGYQDNSIGKMRGDELLSTMNQDNEALWNKKNKDFFELKVAPGEQIFKKLYDDHKGQENSSKLKEKCKELYNSIPSSNQEGIPNAEEVVKYCSMKAIH